MATKSKIKITFGLEIIVGDHVYFLISRPSSFSAIQEEFKGQRLQAGEIALNSNGTYYTMTGEEAALAYVQAFKADWNGSGIFDISYSGRVVTIEVGGGFVFSNFNARGASAVITDGNFSDFKLVGWEVIPKAGEECNKYILKIEATEPIKSYRRIFKDYAVNSPSNILEIEVDRENSIGALVLYNGADSNSDKILFSVDEGIISVGKMLAENISLDINNTPSGATVSANLSFPFQPPQYPELELKYSLNGADYQNSSVFTNQLEGVHTLYIKDNLGCVVTKEFVVDAFVDNTKPIFYISKNNSVFFAKEEEWNGQDIMKNDENTLSESQITGINYKEELLYQKNDFIIIQFKSNYDLHQASIIDCEGNDTDISIEKKSNNIGRFLSLDCKVYEYKPGYTGLYFVSGKVYDENNSELGEYVLNGNLPDFAIVGQNVELIISGMPNGFYKIKDVVYDSNIEKRVIVIERKHDGPVSDAISRSNYNLLEYEIYEFSLSFSSFQDQFYKLRLTASRDGFPFLSYYSESINLKEHHEKTLSVEYWGEGNSDIFYAYGIKHFVRLKVEQISALIDDNVQIVNGDNISAMVESDLYDGNKILFDSVTRTRFLQIAIALSSPNLFINNTGYIKKNSLTYENIENTNLYNVTVDLIKTGVGINENVDNPSIAGPSVSMPGVLAGNTGLIKL